MVSFVVKELSSRSLVVRVSNLTIPIEGRQVTIVVRTRIRSVEEVQCRVGIPRVVVTGSRFEFLLIVDLVLISHNNRRIIRLHDTAVTNLTVLVAPIRVVVVRSGQVINLLGNRCVLATLGRSTKGDQFQTGVVPDLLCRQEVTQRIVLDTFADDTLVVHIRGETIGQLCGNSPAACHHATRISSVHTRFVVTVGTCCTYFPALCIAAGSHQVVGRLTKSTEGEVGSLHRVQHLFVTACVIQTTHSRVVELTALLRTEVQTLDVVVLTIRLITTVAITRCGPGKGGVGVEYIGRCGGCRSLRLRTTFVIRHLFFRQVQQDLILCLGDDVRLQKNVVQLIHLIRFEIDQLERSYVIVCLYHHLFVHRLEVE